MGVHFELDLVQKCDRKFETCFLCASVVKKNATDSQIKINFRIINLWDKIRATVAKNNKLLRIHR